MIERAADAVRGLVVGPRHGGLVIAHAHDVEVQVPVAIEVRDRSHAPPAAGRDASRRAHVDKVPATRVVEKPVPSAHGGDKEVGPAVIVVVEEDDAGRRGGVGVRQTRALCNVGEGTVTVAPVEEQVRAAG